MGLLALMLLHDSRRAARTSPTGDLILLEDQDRSLWNRDQIAEGVSLVERALSSGQVGPYTIQAAIAAVHAQAPSSAATDWAQIVALYDLLMQADPSPVVELNRAVAVAMRDGPLAGLALDRRHPRARRSGELSSGPRGAGGSLPATGANGGSPSLLRTGPQPHAAGAGAAISRATAEPNCRTETAGAASHIVPTSIERFRSRDSVIEWRRLDRCRSREDCPARPLHQQGHGPTYRMDRRAPSGYPGES